MVIYALSRQNKYQKYKSVEMGDQVRKKYTLDFEINTELGQDNQKPVLEVAKTIQL